MTMIIIQYGSYDEAKDKLNQYDFIAHLYPPYTLTVIYEHITLPIWFFNGTDCITHAGLYKQEIAADVASLITGFELDGFSYPATFTIEKYEDLSTLGYWASQPDNKPAE